ncbi:MAG: hypothetical protein OEL55_03035 [Desulfobulbaceae bacterium]|nr:hypothetical protein [Desulfobulbaceae bacterium]
MASKAYCEHVGPELQIWSNKLHALSAKIERASSLEKQKLFPQIEELHIIMTELDDRLSDMTSSCSIINEAHETDDRYPNVTSAAHNNQQKGVSFDYDRGG